ncbi:MAG: serine/threonine protein kinase [Acidobacteria bacterium]|nr:serine/threonine protein kinase [Acidobacteriota bacterium]
MAETPKAKGFGNPGAESRAEFEPDPTTLTGNPSSQSLNPATGDKTMMIGGYRVIRELGRGGMGIVYEAEQQHPRRLVALKVIKGDRFVDESHIKLFERETQALARLRHPGIAAIYESGRTPEGQHFFSMELVRGETLKEYLDRAGSCGPLTPTQLKERLAFFRKIADAVTYAHQRGVIHRDLKPANIIILREFETLHSKSELQTPAIKILDFGLARITETDLAVTTIGTEIGSIQGTLPYMSPEQVRGNPDEIDVRSDVYALGVILYEMLAGRRPYDVNNIMLPEAVRVICETPPTPLSKHRSGKKKLDRDIETIVEKALEKTAARRYQSVAALGDDVSRFISGQPILARPPSAAYQLRKLAARHKVGFGFAAVVIVLITLSAVVMSIQAERIARERDRANREAKISKQVSDFMRSLFRAPDPFRGKGKESTAQSMLDEGSARIAVELRDQPEVQTELALLMGQSYFGLGLWDKAAELAQSALTISKSRVGPESAETASALTLLGEIQLYQGDFDNAERRIRESLEIRRKLFGPNHILVAEDISNLASVNFEKGDFNKAEEAGREALAIYRKVLGDESEEVATCVGNLAMTLKYRGHYGESLALYRESLSTRRKMLSPNHPLIASALNNLAMLHIEMKNYEEADRLFREALAIDRAALGESHDEVSRILKNLGLLHGRRGQLPEAIECYRQSLAIAAKIHGENDPMLASHYENMGAVFMDQKNFPKAEESLRKAVRLFPQQFDRHSWQLAAANSLLGACLANQNKHEEAETLLADSYSVIKKEFGLQHNRTQQAGLRLIALYEVTGKRDRAAVIKTELGMAK